MMALFVIWTIFTLSVLIASAQDPKYVVPLIAHQVYDYRAPSLFFYLSIRCIQRYVKPKTHMLWVNNEGRYRMGHWREWMDKASPG